MTSCSALGEELVLCVLMEMGFASTRFVPIRLVGCQQFWIHRSCGSHSGDLGGEKKTKIAKLT
jgi:hypothetical protein